VLCREESEGLFHVAAQLCFNLGKVIGAQPQQGAYAVTRHVSPHGSVESSAHSTGQHIGREQLARHDAMLHELRLGHFQLQLMWRDGWLAADVLRAGCDIAMDCREGKPIDLGTSVDVGTECRPPERSA
jgi:hypothetical protein